MSETEEQRKQQKQNYVEDRPILDPQQPARGGEADDVSSALQGLVDIQDHTDIERDVSKKAQAAAFAEENAKDENRIANLRSKIEKLEEQKRALTIEKATKERIRAPKGQINGIVDKILSCNERIADHTDEISAFEERIRQREKEAAAAAAAAAEAEASQTATKDTRRGGPTRGEGEDRRAFLIRTGKITPFAAVPEHDDEEEQEGEAVALALEAEAADGDEPQLQTSHQVLRQPGFGPQLIRPPIDDDGITGDPVTTNLETEFGLRPRKRQRPSATAVDRDGEGVREDTPSKKVKRGSRRQADEDEDYSASTSHESEGVESSTEDGAKQHLIKLSVIDDAKASVYKARVTKWVDERKKLRANLEGDRQDDEDEEEWFKPTPGKPNKRIFEDYYLPEEVYDFLFPFQRVGIQWLAELHSRKEGGILCDEMGLGKTVQLISFIATLHFSKKLDGPVIILATTTLIAQWVRHFHQWWPPLRVSILHSTGTGMLNPKLEDDESFSSKPVTKTAAARKIINDVVKDGHVLLTTYRGLDTYLDELSEINWGYAVLDEGHHIRNRTTDAAKACKQLNTWHRIILSGTPIQNNLRELYSLFEFVNPGLLGDLRQFMEFFETPIKNGHHRGASTLAIATGEKCSKTLRDTIKPYMLRRIKADVANSLPPKTEQVFFCKLTPRQEHVYREALEAPEVKRAFNFGSTAETQRRALFSAIETLRKVCNHPDLLHKRNRSQLPDYGHVERSVKMQVLSELLKISKRFGHKTLVFSQSLDILDMIQTLLRSQNISFIRMDGNTPNTERPHMVDEFNGSPDLDVFLLTPQTGGVGLNLTGADRVILYDPAWNPAVDRQAIERAWRLGQTKSVKIYRLLTPGTIEEKMYRKQLYKQFVADNMLKDGNTNRYFDTTNLQDLFDYGYDAPEAPLFDDIQPAARTSNPESQSQTLPHRGARAKAGEPKESESRALNAVQKFGGLEEYKDPGAEEDNLLDAVVTSNAEAVYNHDDVVNARNRQPPEKRLTEQEAHRLNERTVQFLRQQSTRTHAARSAGRPGDIKPREMPVAAMSMGPDKSNWKVDKVKTHIVNFVKRRGGKTQTKDLVTYFNREHRGISSDVFKRALYAVCVEDESGVRGRSVWKLKPGQ
ncbi:hypothetical protein jhhlp_004661 [Lomentospora prolificans]|uniref:Uncharacterized protein n=1 Tax=Lomentospora prolificans TaxID=41688 RepID=A0A2N3NC45_9PEZI|nr:hypothetical protein jhhlp_004661 [Lomentospora prolificans]